LTTTVGRVDTHQLGLDFVGLRTTIDRWSVYEVDDNCRSRWYTSVRPRFCRSTNNNR